MVTIPKIFEFYNQMPKRAIFYPNSYLSVGDNAKHGSNRDTR